MTGHHHDHRSAPRATTAAAPSRLPQDLASVLHARGLRVTPQREQVLTAVRSFGHATPEQISDALPDVDLTTVYRTLELLEDIGMVRHAHLDHRAPAYRPADDDHVHVVCHDCGAVIDAPPALTDEMERRLHAERGFVLDRAHLTVFGRCAACTAAVIAGSAGAIAGAADVMAATAGADLPTPGEQTRAPRR